MNKLSNPIDSDKAYNDLLKNIKSDKNNRAVIKLIPGWFKYAAVFIGLAIIGYGVYFNLPKNSAIQNDTQITLQLEDGSIYNVPENANTKIVDNNGNYISDQKQDELVYSKNDSVNTLAYNMLSVPFGKTFKLMLSDGSKVVLNSGTQLKFPVTFIKGENRTVFLNGEAYFEVAKDAQHPFTVETEMMDVQVLGTHFNVTAYKEDQKTFAVLVEGKVAVSGKTLNAESKILSPNQKASVEGETLKVENVDVNKYVAWAQGQLVFVDDSFNIISNKLERKYNVEIVNNFPDLDNLIITATFSNETIEDVLKTFQTYKNFKYTIKGNVITINKP